MPYQQSIDPVLVTKFSDTVFELAQQNTSRLRSICSIKQVDARSLMMPRIGSIEAQALNSRFPEIVPADISWDQRMLQTVPFGVAMFMDKWDAARMLSDPEAIFAKRAAAALERYVDRCIANAANATVFTGQYGTTPVTAASDGVTIVNAQNGITYDTLLAIEQNFQSQEIGTETMLRKFLLITEEEMAQLMKEGNLISGEFSKQYVIDKGGMTHALSFDIIQFGSMMPNPILQVVGGVRNCLAIATDGIVLGLSNGWDIHVEERNDRWRTKQLLAEGNVGAVRMEGARVQVIQTTV